MIGLRRVALRVLSQQPSSLICRTRAFNTAPLFTIRSKLQPLPISQLQRRFASEEAQTQSEPSADRAEEAQHGDNSIAASSQESQAHDESTELPQATADVASAVDDPVPEQASAPHSTQSEQPSTVGELASAAAERTREAASSAYGTVASLASTSRNTSFEKPQPSPSATVYVGNLFFDVREEDLQREFEKLGPIQSVKVVMDNRGLSKGFGYIVFSSQETADAAIRVYHNQPFEGRRLNVQYAADNRSGPRRPRRQELSDPSRTLFIGNMSFDISDRELNSLFREIRNVVDVRVAIDRRTGQPRGFAHADFTDVESAKEAMLALSGKEIHGRVLRVDYSQGSGRAARGGEGQDQQQGY